MSGTILVVDDIAANRNLLGATLEPKGYEVLLAPNGAARARPTLILMDVNMPEMDGYEACRQLKG
ncbi:MAG: response regulator, partial [Verrucomicrobia bacterium]